MVFGLAFLGTFPYNYIIASKIDNLEKDKQSIKQGIDSLSGPFSIKTDTQKWFYSECVKHKATGGNKTYTELWEILEHKAKVDSIQYSWDNGWSNDITETIQEIGFSTGLEFEQFIESNSLSTDEITQAQSAEPLNVQLRKIKTRIRTEKYKALDSNERMEFALVCLMLIGILLFPLRFLIYSIRWSIRTIKLKE